MKRRKASPQDWAALEAECHILGELIIRMISRAAQFEGMGKTSTAGGIMHRIYEAGRKLKSACENAWCAQVDPRGNNLPRFWGFSREFDSRGASVAHPSVRWEIEACHRVLDRTLSGRHVHECVSPKRLAESLVKEGWVYLPSEPEIDDPRAAAGRVLNIRNLDFTATEHPIYDEKRSWK